MKNISIKVPDDIYEAIIQQRDEAGYTFTSPFIANILDSIFGVKCNLFKQDMKWFKYAYFIRVFFAGMLGAYNEVHSKDRFYWVMVAMGVPINKFYEFTLDDTDYPLTPEISAKLDDVATSLCGWVYNLKLDECNLKVNKLRDKLNIEKLLED